MATTQAFKETPNFQQLLANCYSLPRSLSLQLYLGHILLPSQQEKEQCNRPCNAINSEEAAENEIKEIETRYRK